MTKKNARNTGGARIRNHQNKESIERKRLERSQKNVLKKERKAKGSNGDYEDGDFISFRRQLEYQGFCLREIQGDGNCLFRAFADQLNGDEKMHMRHRKDVVEYMKSHKDDFAPFLDETMTFERYVQNLSSTGTYGGNDSIVAFARHNSVDVVIHQFNSPTFVINGAVDCEPERQIKLHLAYHSMEHYSSVRVKDDPGTGPAYIHHITGKLQSVDCKEYSNSNSQPNQVKKKGKKQHNFNECLSNVDIADTDLFKDDVMLIKNSTGYKDDDKIQEYLMENNYNVEATLCYVLQIMSINELNDTVQIASNEPSESIMTKKDVSSVEEHKSNIETETDQKKEEEKKEEVEEEGNAYCQENVECEEKKEENIESRSTANENVNENKEIDEGVIDALKITKENEEIEIDILQNKGSNATPINTCLCGEEDKIKSEKENNNNKRGMQNNSHARRKPDNKSKSMQHKQHLTNRQRKELAKKERKKRREESKRELSESHDKENNGPDSISLNIKVINV